MSFTLLGDGFHSIADLGLSIFSAPLGVGVGDLVVTPDGERS